MTLDIYCPFSYKPKHPIAKRRCRITGKICREPYRAHFYNCEIAKKQRQLK